MAKTKTDFEYEKLRLEYIFTSGVDFKNRTVRVCGQIGSPQYGPFGDMSEDFCDFNIIDSALTEMEKESIDKPITIKINSPGGSVYEALSIVGRLKASPCQIITEGYGHVMSSATLILACGDVRKLSKYCVSMFHQSSYGVSGSHEEIKEAVQQAEREEKLWARWIAELSNKSESFWYKTVKKKNVYLTSEEMLKYGVVDEIV